MIMQRRTFLAGLGAVFAAPAIVQASSLMVVAPTEIIRPDAFLTVHQIRREAVTLFRNSNLFLRQIDRQYDEQFGRDGAKIGQILRIRLPSDYVVTDGPAFPAPVALPELTAPEMAAIGAAAVLAKNPAVSRRFWSK